MIQQKRFSLIWFLALLIIIGVTTTIGAFPYDRHLSSAKASEALKILKPIISYCKSYHRSHKSWPKKSCNTQNRSTNEWIDTTAGKRNKYFDYYYDKKKLQVWAQGKKRPFTKADKLIYHLATRKWSATGRMVDVKP